ncbi:DgyrCDS12811 [Dimorphilus gyrociliatus]|uniref:DgyrCDS12811 n=1 Tax=Dimorphilus gyrociliatus TaxID=2664684 RepID=A0A7I8W8T4_9ANNE|nr:DgyrCDS12811 [Dimorphilus gyrociliatus]
MTNISFVCPVGKYKPEKGNSICISCPAYSESTAPGSRICQCKIGYYRNKNDDDNMSCTRPPSEPRNLQTESVDQRQAVLTWLPPEDNGRSDLYYKVVCHDCGPNVSYEPSSEVTDTRVTLNNLDTSSDYRVIVYALNGVSEQAGQESMKSTLITVRTSDAR